MARGALALAVALLAAPVEAARIAVDLSDGAILLSDEADAPRRPASLTKLMTAYLAFEALDEGDVTDETPVTISAFAAARPPVKLGPAARARLSVRGDAGRGRGRIAQ